MTQPTCLAICIGCGCDDMHACWDDEADAPCSWLVIDRSAALGICSACPEHRARWDAGDRTFAVPIPNDTDAP